MRRLPQDQGHWQAYLLPSLGGGLEEQELSGLPAKARLASPASHSHSLPLRLLELRHPGLGSSLPPAGRSGVGAGRLAAVWSAGFPQGHHKPPRTACPGETTLTLFYLNQHIRSQPSPVHLCHTYAFFPGTGERRLGRVQSALWPDGRDPSLTCCVALGRPSNLSELTCIYDRSYDSIYDRSSEVVRVKWRCHCYVVNNNEDSDTA